MTCRLRRSTGPPGPLRRCRPLLRRAPWPHTTEVISAMPATTLSCPSPRARSGRRAPLLHHLCSGRLCGRSDWRDWYSKRSGRTKGRLNSLSSVRLALSRLGVHLTQAESLAWGPSDLCRRGVHRDCRDFPLAAHAGLASESPSQPGSPGGCAGGVTQVPSWFACEVVHLALLVLQCQ